MEIEITPAGKSTKRLSLLSGGEKSMTALAFLFAVFLARPCPFYILDEVEAALDDLNLDRFLALLRRYADRAQFIVITHQKRTMEAADWLYGVSMGGDGVSKVLSRRLPPADAQAPPTVRRGRLTPSPAWPERRRRRPVARDWSDLFIVDAGRGAGASAARREERRARGAGCSAGCARTWRRPARRSARRSRRRCSATLDEHTWERLEEALIMADVGAARPPRSSQTLEAEASDGELEGGEALSERLIELLAETARIGEERIDIRAKPTVIMAVGVNGTGKTTTIGKLAWHLQRELGRSVLLGAADTFRAAATEQLRRLGASAPAARSSSGRRARTPARSPSRPIAQARSRGRRRRDHRHRRAPAHPGRPDGRAAQGAPRDRAPARGRAARDAADGRRDDRSERPAPGASCSPRRSRSAASC